MPTGHIVVGEYVLVEPPMRVVFTWGWEGNPDLPPGSSMSAAGDAISTAWQLQLAGVTLAPTRHKSATPTSLACSSLAEVKRQSRRKTKPSPSPRHETGQCC